jgi:riboflavin synthase alpha subunit
MKDIWFKAPSFLVPYLVSKGSIAVDGVSLTMVDVKKEKFSTALVPHTLRHTNLGKLKKGDAVNLEADIMAKYVLKYMKKK